MLRINALGRLVVLGESGPILGSAAQPRRLALLAVIARTGARGVTRSRIIQLLWPESDEEHGRGVLSKALSALRRDLGAEGVFLATNNDVRLNPAVVSTDLAEFDAAMAAGDLATAAGLYIGPFLDGFRVVGAAEFERWAAAERASIERDYVVTLRALAEAAATRGNHTDASRWWGKLAGYEPLNTRHALGLMRSLVAAGEPRAALHHARTYELLLAESLAVPADDDVIALASQIRSSVHSGDEPAAASRSGASAPGPNRPPPQSPTVSAARSASHVWKIAAALVVILGVSAATATRLWRTPEPAANASGIGEPIVAFGRIVDHRPATSDGLPDSVMSALIANVGRAGAARVASMAPARKVLSAISSATDVETALIDAARRAGATELVDGALFPAGGGRLRLDLRRTDLTGGGLRSLPSVTASDALTLADSATAHLVSALRLSPATASSPVVTARSVAARRHYETGLRAFYRADVAVAERAFDAALAADSGFAMAAYYLALATPRDRRDVRDARFRHAVRLADRAPDHDRLTIRAHWAAVSESTAGSQR